MSGSLSSTNWMKFKFQFSTVGVMLFLKETNRTFFGQEMFEVAIIMRPMEPIRTRFYTNLNLATTKLSTDISSFRAS